MEKPVSIFRLEKDDTIHPGNVGIAANVPHLEGARSVVVFPDSKRLEFIRHYFKTPVGDEHTYIECPEVGRDGWNVGNTAADVFTAFLLMGCSVEVYIH